MEDFFGNALEASSIECLCEPSTFKTNPRKNQLVMMIQRACVRMAADVGPRQHAGKARVRIVECEWGFGAPGGCIQGFDATAASERRSLKEMI